VSYSISCISRNRALKLWKSPRSETLEQLLAIRKLKRTTAGLDIERLNAGEQLSRKKRLKVTNEGLEDKEVVGENGMIEGQHGGLKNGAGGGGGRDRVRDEG